MDATVTPTHTQAVTTQKDQFLRTLEEEYATTLRVLRAYPAEKADLRPHPRCKTARELAWVFVIETGLLIRGLTEGFDFSKPFAAPPEAPESMEAVIRSVEEARQRAVDVVTGMREEQLAETIKFLTAPKTIGDWPRMRFAWMMLHDHIHHRGQFSIYLRMADAKVPSIYGPSGDEPWL